MTFIEVEVKRWEEKERELAAVRAENAKLRAVADAARLLLECGDNPSENALRDALAALDPCICDGDKLCMYHHRLKAEEKRGTR